MIIDEVLGIQKIKDPKIKIANRYAARAIVIQDNKILMVHTNKGDYKFPGGGIKKAESQFRDETDLLLFSYCGKCKMA